MNIQMAAVVAGVAFLLSLLAGLFGGVPFLDLLVRALFWAAFGFGGALGVEALLKSLVPDLFNAPEASGADEEVSAPRAVDITLEDEAPSRGGFVEEIDQDAPEVPRYREAAEASPVAPVRPAAEPEGDEEMPEIGSFLDAFKPGAEEPEGEGAAPDLGEYVPSEAPSRSGGSEVTIDGEVQDPAILAKAVQTVMKRDVQGN
jgi:hypothetical protein